MPPKTSTPSENIAITLLSRAHSPTTSNRIYAEKIQHRPLHLKPTQSTRRAARASKRTNAQKPKALSSRQKRSLNLYSTPSPVLYSTFISLHAMWNAYILEVLGASRPVTASSAANLCSADYHGALLTVVRSKCVGRVGLTGIVIKDSRGVFEVVVKGRGEEDGKGDRVVVVPKEGTVFGFVVTVPESVEKEEGKELKFELHGDQFMTRASDRASKMPKWHFLKNI